ncbi:MAG: hypothetical protein ACK56F_15485, partial [bacterium]
FHGYHLLCNSSFLSEKRLDFDASIPASSFFCVLLNSYSPFFSIGSAPGRERNGRFPPCSRVLVLMMWSQTRTRLGHNRQHSPPGTTCLFGGPVFQVSLML